MNEINEFDDQLSKNSNLPEVECPYVVFAIDNNYYAINAKYVSALEVYNGSTPIANSSPRLRGITRFRGNTLDLFDLRKIYGIEETDYIMKEMFEQRILDHQNWMNALEESVEKNTEFKLTTDPHSCAFGKWLDSFKTDNNVLALHLKKLDTPHRAVHAYGDKVKQLMANGEQEAARQIIAELKETHYKETIQLLSETFDEFIKGKREMFVVLEFNEEPIGILVDRIVSVEYLCNFTEVPVETHYSITNLARREKDEQLVFIINAELLFDNAR